MLTEGITWRRHFAVWRKFPNFGKHFFAMKVNVNSKFYKCQQDGGGAGEAAGAVLEEQNHSQHKNGQQ